MDETAGIPEARFPGTKGIEHERVCQKIEKLFLESLGTIVSNCHKILDVQQPTWNDDMFVFRDQMKDLEIIIENLVTATLKNVINVHEAIDNLYGFRGYMRRKNLAPLFDRKTTLVSCRSYGE